MFSDKRMITSCLVAILVSISLLCVNMISTFMMEIETKPVDTQLKKLVVKPFEVPISAENGSVLALFGVRAQEIADDKEDLVPKLPSHIVKILASSRIAERQNMLLEVITNGKSEQGKVEVGAIINGLLVKKVEDKKIVIEKDGEEFEVKLFHQKQLK